MHCDSPITAIVIIPKTVLIKNSSPIKLSRQNGSIIIIEKPFRLENLQTKVSEGSLLRNESGHPGEKKMINSKETENGVVNLGKLIS